MVTQPKVTQVEGAENLVIHLTPEEELESYTRQVAKHTGLTVEEFLARLDAGEWDEVIDDPEYREILSLAVMANVMR